MMQTVEAKEVLPYFKDNFPARLFNLYNSIQQWLNFKPEKKERILISILHFDMKNMNELVH